LTLLSSYSILSMLLGAVVVVVSFRGRFLAGGVGRCDKSSLSPSKATPVSWSSFVLFAVIGSTWWWWSQLVDIVWMTVFYNERKQQQQSNRQDTLYVERSWSCFDYYRYLCVPTMFSCHIFRSSVTVKCKSQPVLFFDPLGIIDTIASMHPHNSPRVFGICINPQINIPTPNKKTKWCYRPFLSGPYTWR